VQHLICGGRTISVASGVFDLFKKSFIMSKNAVPVRCESSSNSGVSSLVTSPFDSSPSLGVSVFVDSIAIPG